VRDVGGTSTGRSTPHNGNVCSRRIDALPPLSERDDFHVGRDFAKLSW
jgi:hypothetical protein